MREIVAGVDLADKLVLDIGCGLGGVDIMLARGHGCRIIALDIEPQLIDRTRANAEEAGVAEFIDFRLVVSGPPGHADGSVDVVFGKDAWVQIADKRALFGEVFWVLKLGGRLLAGDWCRIDQP